jgi:hypothetical protein
VSQALNADVLNGLSADWKSRTTGPVVVDDTPDPVVPAADQVAEESVDEPTPEPESQVVTSEEAPAKPVEAPAKRSPTRAAKTAPVKVTPTEG